VLELGGINVLVIERSVFIIVFIDTGPILGKQVYKKSVSHSTGIGAVANHAFENLLKIQTGTALLLFL
jgi:hypothetical protein